tara:strand:- start:105 stop:461 length:357 start_codon:yes stop_codon:yes gene_type:complete
MLCVKDHPIVQQIDNEILQREAKLAYLQAERIAKTKALLKSTYEHAKILCRNLNIEEQERGTALLFGYEYLTNIQMIEQWLLEQLVELNQCEFLCPLSDLQNKLLMRLNSLQQDAFLY